MSPSASRLCLAPRAVAVARERVRAARVGARVAAAAHDAPIVVLLARRRDLAAVAASAQQTAPRRLTDARELYLARRARRPPSLWSA